MPSGMLVVMLSAALGAGPFGYGSAGPVSTGPVYEEYPAEMGAVETYGPGPVGGFGGGYAEELYPFDAPHAWQHGYFQEIPAYGGYHAFRPYNYKHVLSQSQAAGGWGMSPTMPYSQQYWHRYQDQAAMKQHLSRIGMSEYMAEQARLRAQHDFNVQQQVAREQPSGVSPHAAHAPERFQQAQPVRPSSYGEPHPIVPVDHRRDDRVDDLEYQLRLQERQLQALRHALEQERRRNGQPAFAPQR
ncbi:MAG: hypothetical protein WD066_03420 [Planctomycetaceae bacterium]